MSVLKQNFSQWELIIVDDNSDLKTKKIFEKYKRNKKIRVFFLKSNKGDGYCRLFGVKKAFSNLIAFLDSDDLWMKDKLKLQFKFMNENNLNFTFTRYVAFKSKGLKKIISPPQKIIYEDFVNNTSIATSSMMIKKKFIRNIKLSHSPNFEDYFLKCQILKKIKYAHCLQQNLVAYRIRERSLSKNKLRNVYWIWKINRKFNKLSFVKSLISVVLISINSLRKYGFK